MGTIKPPSKSIVIYPSYLCNLACGYCWVRQLKLPSRFQYSLSDWAKALDHGKDAVVDIVGGEPTILPGIYDFCGSLRLWAMTTNLQDWQAISPFLKRPLDNCLSITCSWSGQMDIEEFRRRVYGLKEKGYNARVSYVRPKVKPIPKDDDIEVIANRYFDAMVKRGSMKMCNAGVNHVSIDPAGDIYRCQVGQMKGSGPMLNLFREGLFWLRKDQPCRYRCIPCYLDGGFGVRFEAFSI